MKSSSKIQIPGSYIFHKPLIYIPIVLAAFVAWFAPEDVLNHIPWIQPASELLMKFFPAMTAYVRKSAFPQVTELYFFLMAIHCAFHVPYLYNDYRTRQHLHHQEWNASLSGKLRFAFSAFVMGPILTVFLIFFNAGYDLSWMPVNSSRLALGAFGWLLAGAGAVVIAVTSVLWIWGILSGGFRSQKCVASESRSTDQ